MNKKSKSAAAEAQPKAREAKQASARKAAKEKPAKAPAFDFVGKVESIGLHAGPDKPALTFGLKGRNGTRRVFQISASESVLVNGMVTLLTAARAAETKIGVRVGVGDTVLEVQSRPGLGKSG